MKMNNVIILSLTGLGIWMWSKIKSIRETVDLFHYNIDGVAFRMRGFTPTIIAKLNIYNPNRTSVPVNGVAGQVYFKKQMIATFSDKKPININGNEATIIELTARVSILGVVNSLFTKEAEKDIEIKGLLKTAYFDMPFEYKWGLKIGNSPCLKNPEKRYRQRSVFPYRMPKQIEQMPTQLAPE